ncbi:ubiquitin carboxyl-terminal hydrolase 32-like isoform X2 [Babylonia areolata]|uniref:ubiquitin carboxyl-terminal hydrolase 32-like isoform X2 n=1 Tax=Babylonia areolata TaxID=304850 RepID=UPI003FCF9265
MGGKDSKLAFISYEDATRRVSEAELKRLKEAFKRSSTMNGCMTETLFSREVLLDGVPPKLAQLMFKGFGGSTKGVSFKDLLCGLVVLTKGTREEKIKLIFGMYADETYSYVQKDEMDRKVLESEGHVSPALCDLFRESDQVTYEQFYSWVRDHPDATIICQWLLTETSTLSLSNDMDTPTFYQTLAGVTHLEENDIIELEKRYWTIKALSKTGCLDLELFRQCVCPPLPDSLCDALFVAFDENKDSQIDFKEMACGISACCRGPSTERQKFCFKVFDKDHDGQLNEQELTEMLESLDIVRNEYNSPEALAAQDLPAMDPASVAKEILSCHDTNKNGSISQEDYLMWTVNNNLTDDFLSLLSQICHIGLGLRPQNREEEGKIVQNWLEREGRHKMQVGQVFYLISMQWWNTWMEYVSVGVGEAQSQGLSSSANSTPKHRITKGRGGGAVANASSSSLAWEDEGVVTISVTRSSGAGAALPVDTKPNGGGSPRLGMHNARRLGASLAAPDMGLQSHSPSTSPKLKRKILPPIAVRPPAIDNSPLLASSPHKFSSLTNEGGRLRRDIMLVRGKDFEIVPEPIWRALASWYGGAPALPRTVIMVNQGDDTPTLELYPLSVKLYRHHLPSTRPPPSTTFTGMMAGIGGIAWNLANSSNTPRRTLAYTAAFSRKHTMQQVYEFLCNKLRFNREDVRLWKISMKDEQNLTLLDDELQTVEDAGVDDNQPILIEIRNKDLTWPEEMSQLAKNKTLKKDEVPTTKGATGLNNLGNTCFMNAALQCVSNTWALTQYFAGGLHLFELNRDNPIGMKGHIAQRYGELIKDLWSGTSKAVAPLKLRWTIGKYAPRFNGFQQHDSQEFLSFLLDGLHEDLNRVHRKPYVELKDSSNRPDQEVAREQWENHLLRNQSIIVDLFHGQLRSKVRCKECSTVSTTFDPYSYLTLPLPMDSCIHLEILVNRLDGSTPVKYGLRLNMDEKYKALKQELSTLSGIPADQLLLVEILGPIVKTLPRDDHKIRMLMGSGTLYAYELPAPALIPTMSAEEESAAHSIAKENIGLNEIQRGKIAKQLANSSPSPSPSPSRIPNGQPPQLVGGDSSSPSPSPSPSHGGLQGGGGGGESPSHSRSNSSVVGGSVGGSVESLSRQLELFDNFLIGVHRKMVLMDVYFMSAQKTRPSLFGTPIIIPRDESTTGQDLYHFVWVQVSRLVSPLPPNEQRMTNHAQDCLGYEYPFTLKLVLKDGTTCAKCPWYRFCRGCRVDCNAEKFDAGRGGSFVAIDWEPTALHLRYQTSLERYHEEHESVAESRRLQVEPIDLDTCLQAFTKEEELGEDGVYRCSSCKKMVQPIKKLDIWRLPPVLVISLKRFQYLGGRWVKSHKIVHFPRTNFDPTKYLTPRDSSSTETKEQLTDPPPPLSTPLSPSDHGDEGEKEEEEEKAEKEKTEKEKTTEEKEEEESQMKSLSNGQPPKGLNVTSQIDEKLKQYDTEDFTGAQYDLYAMSCHTGIMGGGHYVAYSKNPNGKWYCYNDSSCKEVAEDQLDTNSAYILFYERRNIDFSKFMPDTTGKEPDLAEIDDEFESDFKKMCVLQ